MFAFGAGALSGAAAVGKSRHASPAATPATPPRGKQDTAALTAGIWDDGANFRWFRSYSEERRAQQLPGILATLPSVRVRLRLAAAMNQKDDSKNGGGPTEASQLRRVGIQVCSAAVQPTSGGWCRTVVTGSDGTASLTISHEEWAVLGDESAASTSCRVNITVDGGSGGEPPRSVMVSCAALSQSNVTGSDVLIQLAPPTASGVRDTPAAPASPAARRSRRLLQLALVVDTTGSMADEMRYLAAEIEGIVSAVRAEESDVDQEVAVAFYRDVGDEYVVKLHPFTRDLAETAAQLRQEHASGGGDYPEAPDEAIAQAVHRLQWNTTSPDVVPIVFWIADAPHHAEKRGAMLAALQAAATMGLRIYPIAASGADELTEHTMRTAAVMTGGRYLFLTDDSGVGGSHKEPKIPCYFVTTLAHAMRRAIVAELDGGSVPAPQESDVIRHVGDVQERACTMRGDWTLLVS